MSLKDLTWDKHQAAEDTDFMKSVFKKKMPTSVWADYTYNKMLWYGAIETKASAEGYLDDLPGIQRAYFLYQDAKELLSGEFPKFRQCAIDYHRYILDLPPGLVLAHLYVWHMGDLFGGQMIKKIVDAPSRALTFKDPEQLKVTIRTKLKDTMADEANVAFDWAIKLLNDYELSSME